MQKKVIVFSAILLTLLILSSGCSTITSVTQSFQSAQISTSSLDIHKVDYNYQTPTPGTGNPVANVTVNATPTEIPKFVYV